MIKTLQKRFIIASMLAVTILLLILLGAINIGNIYVSQRQIREMTGALINEETMLQPPHKDGEPKGFFGAPTDERSRMTAVYFTVGVGGDNSIIRINTDRIPYISDEEAASICKTAIESGDKEGKIEGFRYASAKNERDGSTVYLFLDTTMQLREILRVLLFSAVAGVVCWAAMLLLVILISKRAIRPIAENIARQKQFVTDAGHEIKTPLAIILANTEAMELYEGENKWSKNIREQTERLSGLMQNLLTLARADEGEVQLRRESFSMSSLLTETLGMFDGPIGLKALAITSQIDPSVTVKADREAIRRLISILIDNAVKYSPEGGEVKVVLERKGKNAVLSIMNSCEELPECEPEKLFDRFYRADAARSRESGGYGIGLSAAKSIVESYGGSISAAYRRPDKIEFVCTL